MSIVATVAHLSYCWVLVLVAAGRTFGHSGGSRGGSVGFGRTPRTNPPLPQPHPRRKQR